MALELSKLAQEIGKKVGNDTEKKLAAFLGEKTEKDKTTAPVIEKQALPPKVAMPAEKIAVPASNDKVLAASETVDNKAQEEINDILEDRMRPMVRPYDHDVKEGVSVERILGPEPHPHGERAYSKEEEEDILGVEKINEEKRRAERDKTEAALDKARQDYVAAFFGNEKAAKEMDKLTGIRAKLKAFWDAGATSYDEGKRRDIARSERLGGAQAEAKDASDKFSMAQGALKAVLKEYRDGEVARKKAELRAGGKNGEAVEKEMEKYAKDILLTATLREAAKIDSLKSNKRIEQMGAARRFINEKAEEFTDWYRKLPVKYKMAVSIGLMGAGIVGGIVGSAAIVSAAFAGQAALRVLGGSMMTAGAEQLIKGSQEKSAERKLSKEFSGKFLESLKNQNSEIDNKLFELIKAKESEKTRRFILAGTLGALVGSGALAQAVRNGINSEFGQDMIEKIKSAAEKTIDFAKHPLTGGFDVDKEVLREKGYNELKSHLPSEAPSETPKTGMPPAGNIAQPEKLAVPGGAKAGAEIFNLKIGARGPEGAIIDHFRAKPDVAKAFGWDGKTDINKWAGTKAHQLWLKSVDGELARPGVAAKLTEHGFTVDAEGYAKAMHHIGKGAMVELNSQGNVHLSDNAEFFKEASHAALSEASLSEAPAEPTPGAEHLLNDVDATNATIDGKITQTVSRLVEPGILRDETFMAAAKVPLGKILESIPPEAYANKYALGDYWRGAKPSQLDLPGSSWLGLTYGDYLKYAEMAKFLRQSVGVQGIDRIKNMAVGEFLGKYMQNADKKIIEAFNRGIIETK